MKALTKLKLVTLKEGSFWYIEHGRRRRVPTGFPKTEKANAEAARKEFEGTLRQSKPKGAATVADVLAWARTHTVVDKTDRFGLAAVEKAFEGEAAAAFTQDRVDDILKNDWPSHATGNSLALATKAGYLGAFIGKLRAYGKAHGQPKLGAAKIGAMPTGQKERILRDGEFTRLLMACAGLRWVPDSRSFARIEAKRRSTARRQRAPIRRLMLFMTGSGSNRSCAARTRWEGTPGGSRSFVDLERRLLHRLGPDAPAKELGGFGVEMTDLLVKHLRRWRKNARDGRGLVIPDLPHVTTCHFVFRQICKDAGVENLTLSDLSRTFAAWAAMEGASLRSISMSIGIRGPVVVENFAVFAPTFQEEAARALRVKPDSIR